jgi:glycosyltransferase involved in cell wall biosynthesis
MRVLQVSDFYRPVIGGLERHVETLSRELVRLGHSVTVVTLQTGDDPAEETLDGVRVVRIRGWSGGRASLHADAGRPFHPTVPDPGAMAALRRVVRRENPAVVHSHSWLQYSYFPLHRRQVGPAHVVTLHDHGLACAKKTLELTSRGIAAAADGTRPGSRGQPCAGPRLAKCLACAPDQYGVLKGTAITTGLRASRLLHSRADGYIALSRAVADGARSALPGNCDTVVIPTMVPDDLPELARSAARPGFLPPDDGYLMFVGALGPYKGVDVLLQARRMMRNRAPLVLIGTPRADTPRIDDPGVVVVRNVPSPQVMASWMRASVAVVPSVWSEPMGQAAIEAMLVGRPVVASDVGGLPDVVEHGATGLMVPPGEPAALAEALDCLLDDPQRRQRMGEAGRLSARKFAASAVVPRIVAVFEEAVRRRDRARPGAAPGLPVPEPAREQVNHPGWEHMR